MRSRVLISAGVPAALALIAAAGCTPVGAGIGSATGMLWILDCVEGDPWMDATQDAPAPYDLKPTFFAGEPIGEPPQNRLIMRMQKNGNAAEINDVLYFDVPNSYEVARCLRGAYDPITGEPDWDTGTGTIDPAVTTPWCEQVGPNGVPRIHLVPFGPVRASLTPLDTCHMTSPGPTIVSITAVASDGWIEFEDFGTAATPDVPVADREQILTDFKVNYDDQLSASFQLTLDDDRVQTAIYRMIDVPPAPRIGGDLTGFFDFELKRGRSAQTFP